MAAAFPLFMCGAPAAPLFVGFHSPLETLQPRGTSPILASGSAEREADHCFCPLQSLLRRLGDRAVRNIPHISPVEKESDGD